MSEKQCACSCKSGPTLIFPCSGAADVGELSDRVARHMTRKGVGKIYCLAGIGGEISGIVESTKSAKEIMAIDGCPLDCAKKILEKRGFASFHHVRLTDIGFKKGETTVDSQAVEQAADNCTRLLGCS